jgi:DNA-binding Lrp family transcriptional regulator
MTEEPKTIREELKVTGSQLVDKVKELLHEGNIRRIVIKQDGQTVMELPLTIAAVGIIVAPVLAAVGAFAALATNCSIVVERIVKD